MSTSHLPYTSHKEVHGKIYVHWTMIDRLPENINKAIKDALRILKAERKDLPGPIFDLVKWEKYHLDSFSFLWYENFDSNAHPPLVFSVKISRATKKITTAVYKKNRPILHRKDSLVDVTYNYFYDFATLTKKEEELGLLNRSDIGREDQWNSILKKKGIKIEGHRIRII